MLTYIIGFGLLFGGFVTFRAECGPRDNTPIIYTIRYYGGFMSLIVFVLGFIVYPKWVPFAGFFSTFPLWIIINSARSKPPQLPLFWSLLIMGSPQLGILFGSTLAMTALAFKGW